MKKIFNVCCFIFCGVIAMYSCKDPENTLKTNTDLLTQSAWKFKNHFYKTIHDTVFYELNLYCVKDSNLLYFYKSKKVEERHPEKCGPEIVHFEGETWSFNKGESVLFINSKYGYEYGHTSYTVAELTEYRLVLVDTLTNYGDSLFTLQKYVLEH